MRGSRATAGAAEVGTDRVPGNLVAEPSVAFWLLKILTTGMGETTSDFLVRTFDPVLVVPATLLVLLLALTVQVRSTRFHPARYWLTALLISIFGTMAADTLHVGLGVPYAVSTAAFAVILATVFVLWSRLEHDLSVHHIRTRRRQWLYWAVVMSTFALGTATGDLTATTLHLGYLASGVLFAVLFAIPGLLFAVTRRGAVLAFWAAYVLTRPLGASLADWLAVPSSRGGLGLGTGPVSSALLLVFVLAVTLLSVAQQRRDRMS